MDRKYILKLTAIALLLIGFGLTACETGDNHSFVPDAPSGPDVMQLVVNGERYDVVLPASESINLHTLNTEFSADIQILNVDAFKQISINDQNVVDGRFSLPISKIGYTEKIKIVYAAGTQLGTVTLNTLHNGIPPITSSGQAQIPGHFYLSFIWRPLIMKYDNDGQVVYYRYQPTDKAGTPEELGYWDFKKHVFNGKTYYSYHAPDPAFADHAFTGYCPGMRILMDEHYTPVDTIHALRSLDGYLPEGAPLDGHDFYFFSPTHWIASASYIERESNGRKLAVGYLQEVDNGQVVFDWWSTAHPEMLEWASPIFDTSYDYVHFNAVDVLPDGNWLCSFRTISSVVKIDSNPKGTGQILWRIDGESLSDAYSFYGQHYARFHPDNHTLTIFDNGNGHTPKHTRLLRLALNPDTGDISGEGDIMHDASGYFTVACGAFQDYGGQGFVAGWGWSMTEGDNGRLVTEHTADGTEVFRLSHVSPNYLLNELNSSYRCVKYE